MGQVWTWIIQGIGHLLAGLKAAVGGMVGKVLATFGLSIVTFQSVLPALKAYLLGFIGQMPVQMLEFLGSIGIGIAMSMILSALAVRMAWKIFIVPTAVANALPGAQS